MVCHCAEWVDIEYKFTDYQGNKYGHCRKCGWTHYEANDPSRKPEEERECQTSGSRLTRILGTALSSTTASVPEEERGAGTP